MDGRLEAGELASLSLSAEMAVLSACRSGLGRTSSGAGILGFAWALQQAGCPAVVTTLWDVEDAATSRLMVTFYQQLKQGKPKDEALRAAMQTERKSDSSSPRKWALLRITGNTGALYANAQEYKRRLALKVALEHGYSESIRPGSSWERAIKPIVFCNHDRQASQ